MPFTFCNSSLERIARRFDLSQLHVRKARPNAGEEPTVLSEPSPRSGARRTVAELGAGLRCSTNFEQRQRVQSSSQKRGNARGVEVGPDRGQFPVPLRANRTIWTESSHKYSKGEGFRWRKPADPCEARWVKGLAVRESYDCGDRRLSGQVRFGERVVRDQGKGAPFSWSCASDSL